MGFFLELSLNKRREWLFEFLRNLKEVVLDKEDHRSFFRDCLKELAASPEYCGYVLWFLMLEEFTEDV